MNDREILAHIADRYSPLDILEILGIVEDFEPEDIDEMESDAVVKIYKRKILNNIEEFGV